MANTTKAVFVTHATNCLFFFCVLFSKNLVKGEDVNVDAFTKFNPDITHTTSMVDHITKAIAYKDLVKGRCYIELLQRFSVNHENGKVYTQNSQTMFKHRTMYLWHQHLSRYQLLQTVGKRIADFCRGFPTFLLLKEKLNSKRTLYSKPFVNSKPTQENKLKRHKRSDPHYFVGRVRGQTQSQYLHFGSNGEPGRAEAESTLQGSKAVVSGTSGMGQAQSQSSPWGCEDCYVNENSQAVQFGAQLKPGYIAADAQKPDATLSNIGAEYIKPPGITGAGISTPGSITPPTQYPGRGGLQAASSRYPEGVSGPGGFQLGVGVQKPGTRYPGEVGGAGGLQVAGGVQVPGSRYPEDVGVPGGIQSSNSLQGTGSRYPGEVGGPGRLHVGGGAQVPGLRYPGYVGEPESAQVPGLQYPKDVGRPGGLHGREVQIPGSRYPGDVRRPETVQGPGSQLPSNILGNSGLQSSGIQGPGLRFPGDVGSSGGIQGPGTRYPGDVGRPGSIQGGGGLLEPGSSFLGDAKVPGGLLGGGVQEPGSRYPGDVSGAGGLQNQGDLRRPGSRYPEGVGRPAVLQGEGGVQEPGSRHPGDVRGPGGNQEPGSQHLGNIGETGGLQVGGIHGPGPRFPGDAGGSRSIQGPGSGYPGDVGGSEGLQGGQGVHPAGSRFPGDVGGPGQYQGGGGVQRPESLYPGDVGGPGGFQGGAEVQRPGSRYAGKVGGPVGFQGGGGVQAPGTHYPGNVGDPGRLQAGIHSPIATEYPSRLFGSGGQGEIQLPGGVEGSRFTFYPTQFDAFNKKVDGTCGIGILCFGNAKIKPELIAELNKIRGQEQIGSTRPALGGPNTQHYSTGLSAGTPGGTNEQQYVQTLGQDFSLQSPISGSLGGYETQAGPAYPSASVGQAGIGTGRQQLHPGAIQESERPPQHSGGGVISTPVQKFPSFGGGQQYGPESGSQQSHPGNREQQYDPGSRGQQYGPGNRGQQYGPGSGGQQYGPERGQQYGPGNEAQQYDPESIGQQYGSGIGGQQYNPVSGGQQYGPGSGGQQYGPGSGTQLLGPGYTGSEGPQHRPGSPESGVQQYGPGSTESGGQQYTTSVSGSGRNQHGPGYSESGSQLLGPGYPGISAQQYGSGYPGSGARSPGIGGQQYGSGSPESSGQQHRPVISGTGGQLYKPGSPGSAGQQHESGYPGSGRQQFILGYPRNEADQHDLNRSHIFRPENGGQQYGPGSLGINGQQYGSSLPGSGGKHNGLPGYTGSGGQQYSSFPESRGQQYGPGYPASSDQLYRPSYPDSRQTTGQEGGIQKPSSELYTHGGVGVGAHPSSQLSTGADNSDSQAQVNIQHLTNKTLASSSAQGQYGGGTAQSQVSGSYSGGGTFTAQAGTIDGKRGAQTQITAGNQGATGSAQGTGGAGRSQVQVELLESGATQSAAQSSGMNHGTNSQTQVGDKGGMADAQANGPGQTSSQAQIGFTPYDKDAAEEQNSPFRGGGSASAQSGSYSGQTQSQIQGKFQFGIRYTGSAQAGSGSKDAKSRNLTSLQEQTLTSFTPLKPLFNQSDFHSSALDAAKVDRGHYQGSRSTLTSPSSPNSTPQPPPTKLQNIPLTPNGSFAFPSQPEADSGNVHLMAAVPTPTVQIHNQGSSALDSKTISSAGNKNVGDDDEDDQEYDEDYDDYQDATPATTENPKRVPRIITQSGPLQKQHIVLPPLEDLDATVTQSKGDSQLREGAVLHPGQYVPGTPGYKIPAGFRGKVTSVANGPYTLTRGQHSQAQSVTLTPGRGKVVYQSPHYQAASRTQLRSGGDIYGSGYTYELRRGANDPKFVSATKSETGYKNPHTGKKTPQTYYTQSSSCGYFTNTCIFNGSQKICYPKRKVNPDGSPIVC